MTLITGSLRGRFLTAVFLWVTIGVATIWFSASRIFSSHVEATFHEELDVHVKELAGLTQLDGRGQPYLTRPLSDPRYAVPGSGFYWQIRRPGFLPVNSASMRNSQLDDSIAARSQISHFLGSGPTGPTIAYGFSTKLPEIRYVIATDKRLLDAVTRQFDRDLLRWLGGLALGLFAGGMALVYFGLKPFERLADAIGNLRRGDTLVIEGQYPKEVAPLIDDLNAYVSATDATLVRARVEAGKLAHNLRTPLAVVTDEAERMEEMGVAPESAQTFLEQSQRMSQQIDFHLARAQVAAVSGKVGRVCSLPCAMVAPITAMRKLYPDIQFLSLPSGSDGMRIACDSFDFGEIISNLLDNAGKWAESKVECSILKQGRFVQVIIEDDGPGLPTEQLAPAFKLGERFGAAGPGSGLGLAIARDLARELGGEISLHPKQDGKSGLRAIISLPAA